MILDTTALIDLLSGDFSIKEKIKKLYENNVALLFTSISVFEIWQGSEDIENKEKVEKIHSLLNSLNSFNFDIDSAKEAGSIHAKLKKKGQAIDPEDSMIAGIAKLNNETLLTRNVKHFSRVEGLGIEFY